MTHLVPLGATGWSVPAGWQAGPRFEYPAVTVPQLVLARAADRPDAVAVRQWDQRLSYGELVSIAARLAASLQANGVRPGDRVGVCLCRRPPMVAGLLGVLLSGAAYVPLDPDGPPVRRDAMAADAGLDVIVVDADTAALFPDSRVLPVPAGSPGVPIAEVRCLAGVDHPAYVLFTSGSTGRPKGVVVGHRSLTSFATAFGAVTGMEAQTVAFGYASLGFDVSVLDIFVPLVAGGAVALVGESDRTDPARLQRFAAEHRVGWGCLPVGLLPLLDPDALPDWHTVITGAEAPGPEQVLRRWVLHPALLDVATSFGSRGEGSYLPLSYGRVLVRGPLPGRFYSHLRYRGEDEPGVLVADLTLVDETGTEVVAISEYLLRKVDTGAIAREVEGPARHGIRPADGAEALRRVLAAHLGPQVVINTETVADLFVRARRTTAETIAAGVAATEPAGPADTPATDTAFSAPSNETERILAQAWVEALGVDRVDVDDDFFALGGNSLVAVQLIAKIRKAVGVRLPMRSLFETPTVRGLAARVEQLRKAEPAAPATAATTIPRLQRSAR
jgi:acyl carrier protein